MYEKRADLGNTRKGDGAATTAGIHPAHRAGNYATTGRSSASRSSRSPTSRKTPEVAAAVLADYFKSRAVDESAVDRDWETARRKVNGGLNGWEPFRVLVQSLERELGNEEPGAGPARRGPRSSR